MKTWIYIDHFKGEVQPGSWEALGLGKTFGTVSAIVFGLGRGRGGEGRVRIWRG